MSQQLINVGTLPNDTTGDPLRTAFQKINNNFSQLFANVTAVDENVSVGTAGISSAIWSYPANSFTYGNFQINSVHVGTANAQNISMHASFDGQNANLLYNGFATLFHGNTSIDPIITDYSFTVANNMVQLNVTPAVSGPMWHSISYRVVHSQYVAGDFTLTTEGNANVASSVLTTEINEPLIAG